MEPLVCRIGSCLQVDSVRTDGTVGELLPGAHGGNGYTTLNHTRSQAVADRPGSARPWSSSLTQDPGRSTSPKVPVSRGEEKRQSSTLQSIKQESASSCFLYAEEQTNHRQVELSLTKNSGSARTIAFRDNQTA